MQTPEFLNHIGGQWAPAQSRESLEKLNPFDGKILGRVSSSGPMDVILALQSAKKAQVAYEKTSLSERAEFLRKIATALEEEGEAAALLEATHQGLSLSFVQKNSLNAAVYFFRKAAQECEHFSEGQGLAQPLGLVSLLTSWCLSLRLVCERLAPALAAGNAVLVKVSELSPVTAEILVRALGKANAPVGLVQFIHGSGAQVGNLLAAHPSIRAVSFVGEISRGEGLIRAASAQYKKLQLSLGAKNSALVLADCDFENKMPQILSSFLQGQGQMCWNSSRLFILESAREKFLEVQKAYLETLTPAKDPRDSSPWLPLIGKCALEKISQRESLAQAEHAKFIRGQSYSGEGFFAAPTWTLDLTNCSVLQQDELHSPLSILTSVKYSHEMVKWSNTGYYGHSAVIWGSSEKAHKLAHQLQCSKVWINSWMGDFDPIAGHRQSSFGALDFRSFGDFYSDVKKVAEPLERQGTDSLSSSI